MSKEGKIRGNLHPMMDGDTDGDPHWSTRRCPPRSKWGAEGGRTWKKKLRTARGAITHWYKGTDLMRVHQGQLTGTERAHDPTRFSEWGRILWMWLARSLSEKPLTMTLGLVSSAYTGFLGSSLFGCSPSWTWREGGGTWTTHRAGDPDCSWGWRGRKRGSGGSGRVLGGGAKMETIIF